ncbi:hypothetical protein HPB51_008537 [Rhipicephalus microplus]|uniref:Uncharacterized protein n=1 Tax=Rhipicephalus microplus TaxID=6941 RepID=A0A9J6ERU9_RHIMP|nr:hypothetical protein HPB51_008537 [Rhipicephalus microplus]
MSVFSRPLPKYRKEAQENGKGRLRLAIKERLGHGGVGGGRGGEGKRGGGVGGQINSVHRDPYTDVADDENDEYGSGRNGDNRGGRRGELSGRESQGGNGNAGPGDSRDNGGGLRRRMDCVVDRTNTCIEWCRLKPTDTRLRQNRDNEPCRYWVSGRETVRKCKLTMKYS